MEKGYSLIKLDGLQYELTNAISLVLITMVVMEDGIFAAESLIGSLHAAHNYLDHLNSQIRDCIDALFEEVRAEKGD